MYNKKRISKNKKIIRVIGCSLIAITSFLAGGIAFS